MFFTIDGPHTRDMDDAIELEADDAGWIVRVAISDVTRVVKPGSADDVSARARGATKYYSMGNSPMLGRNLADWSLSLMPGRVRHVLVAEMRLDRDAQLQKTTLKLDTITSQAKLYYDQVPGIILDHDHALSKDLVDARLLAHRLLNRRRAAGAMVVYDLNNGWVTTEEGSIKQLDSKEETIGYIIIQELMILANTAVALYCVEHDIPVIYRNHEAKTAVDRQALMGQIAEAMVTPLINLEALQHRTHLLLDRAYYKPTLMGHFGLNVAAYLHFTSPIRRYADLVNHQQLRAHLKGHPRPHTQEDLEVIAAHLNKLSEDAREKSAEFFKERAEGKARRQIDARLLDGLIPKEFERALKVELRSGAEPSEAMQDAWIRRLDQNTVPPICMTLVLMHIGGADGWDALREATVESLDERTEDAITILTQAVTLGWPQARIDSTQEGASHAPSFRATATIHIEALDTVYQAVVVCKEGGSSKLVKQHAAVALLRNIVMLKSDNSSVHELVLPKAPVAVAPKAVVKKGIVIDPNKNPISTLIEVSQAEFLAPPEFAFTQKGPPHKPEFTCLARFKHFVVEVTAASKQEAKTLAARQLVEKLA